MKATKIESLPTDKAYQLFTCKRVAAEEIQVNYELVIPMGEVDCRGTFDHKGRATSPASHRLCWLDKKNNTHLPLGRTKIGTRNKRYPFSVYDKPEDGPQIDLPFRDGAHCSWDNEKLGGIGVYYDTGEEVFQLHPAKITDV